MITVFLCFLLVLASSRRKIKVWVDRFDHRFMDVGKRQSKGGGKEGGRDSHGGTVAVPEWELLHGDGDWEGLGVGGGMD